MRKLEEHFCTFEQTQKLMSFGLIGIEHLKHITPSNEILYQLAESCLGAILRSQALDFFRDKNMLGEVTAIDDWNSYTYGIWMEDCISPFFKFPTGINEYPTYPEAESALIDKLIEIQMEVQNGE